MAVKAAHRTSAKRHERTAQGQRWRYLLGSGLALLRLYKGLAVQVSGFGWKQFFRRQWRHIRLTG
jgi:hypothetical protein